MILECLNAACRTPLLYLRGGRIVRIEYRSGTSIKLEHFWLCDDCARSYVFRIFSDRPAVAIPTERAHQRYVTSEQAGVMTNPPAGHDSPGPAAAQLRQLDSSRVLYKPDVRGTEPGWDKPGWDKLDCTPKLRHAGSR